MKARALFRDRRLWIWGGICLPVLILVLDFHICILRLGIHVYELPAEPNEAEIFHGRVLTQVLTQHPIAVSIMDNFPASEDYAVFVLYKIGYATNQGFSASECDRDSCDRCKDLPPSEWEL